MESNTLYMAKASMVSMSIVLLQLSGCLGQDYPFLNPSLPWAVRVRDLIDRLSLEEMVLQMARGGAMKNGPAPAIPRLGIKPYNWNTECLRGDVQAPGYSTSYPQAIGLAASFSPELILKVANATATEVRAKHNYFMSIGNYDDHTGLSCFSPVINIMRHPLWGRNQETYGEDPYLSGLLAAAFVKGLQGDHPRYIKANAGCKHFDAHGGPENIPVSRFSFDAKVEENDLRMTFLPQFQACVEAGTYSIMCSYNRVNGIPACANKKLLTDILRSEWGFKGYVVSDEGALEFITLAHKYSINFLEAAIASVNSGCNLDLSFMVDNVFMRIKDAVNLGNITVETVKDRLYPLFYTRMRLGEFDPPNMNPYSSLDLSSVQTQEHRDLAVEAAIKSFVLLKNLGNTLPMDLQGIKGKKFGIIGPFADNASELFGDYEPHPDPQYISTPRDGIAKLPVEVRFAPGCSDAQCKTYSSEEITTLVKSVDITIVCLGTAAGRPLVLLLFNAGPLDISWAQDSTGVHSIFECFFPAQATGTAIVKLLTGAEGANPGARLPATWPAGMDQVPAMENYTMHGRTYRYYGNQVPLYPFGYGLSYTTFEYSDLVVTPNTLHLCESLDLSVQVKNSGSRTGDEVIQVYMSWTNASVPVPRWQLVGVNRVTIPLNGSVKVSFSVLPRQRAVWTNNWILEPGKFNIYVGGQQPFQVTKVPSNVLQADFTVLGVTCPLNTC
ncbi:uncharacterized protein LOC130356112 isoform X2 [Hyla sarda]|uniref:uncharacterized protein LOC130356112 isoform X2 n=1 Tax=Hyla sarda TaxID=327740 RepID=UPI0024C2A251|nr:uncharacterized protein LOC130356112 isoform X2 [Hyla sarda]